MPAVVLDGGQVELLRDLGRRHRALDVLLVGEHKHRSLPQLL